MTFVLDIQWLWGQVWLWRLQSKKEWQQHGERTRNNLGRDFIWWTKVVGNLVCLGTICVCCAQQWWWWGWVHNGGGWWCINWCLWQ